MNRKVDLEGRLSRHFADEAPNRAPDWVLGGALASIDATTQRRVLLLAPWRYSAMNNVSKLAVAAVAVVAVGILGIYALGLGSGPGQPPTATPSPPPSPTLVPTPTIAVTPAPTPTGQPPLTETFTSAIHGLDVSYPIGWVPRAATEPWPSGENIFQLSPFGDVIEDGSPSDTAFLAMASQPLDGRAFGEWAAIYLNLYDCASTEPITIDGVVGVIGVAGGAGQAGAGCPVALVSSGDRGYLFWLYRISDVPWFREVLATVRLHPEDAVDTVPSPSP